MLSLSQIASFKEKFGDKKIFSQALMPVRGPEGFRQLDYDFPNQIVPEQIIKKLKDHGFNSFGLVVKDTDGATLADVQNAWNPSKRDLLKEFSEICEQENLIFMISVTCMNDAYRGHIHPETVSIHIKNPKIFGRDHKAGDPATHYEGEMRVELPKGTSLEEMKKKIPFLTEKYELKKLPNGEIVKRYIPLTSFHCPRSEHVDYLLGLVKEMVKKYKIDGVLADYIRYHHGYIDLCGCERCRKVFLEKYPKGQIGKGKLWYKFKRENIVEFGKKFNEIVKSIDDKIITGWFNLPGPKIYSNRLVAQDYRNLTNTMDCVIPMTYPYLAGTRDDGRYWGFVGNLVFWYLKRNMNKRFKEYADPNSSKSIFCITNSVECNAEEMLKQCIAFDYGLGIALFKYYGTSDSQWLACKLYSELLNKQKVGEAAPSWNDIKQILINVYEKYPPKYFPKWYIKDLKKHRTNHTIAT